MLLQLFAIMGFGVIAYQDLKDRMVSIVLFPIVGMLLAWSYLLHSNWQVVALNALLNLSIVSIVIGVLWLYTTRVLKKGFLNISFGLGDLLFFLAFALGFPTEMFIILFAFSLCFSVLAQLFIRSKNNNNSVPLAGLMAIFLVPILILQISFGFHFFNFLQ